MEQWDLSLALGFRAQASWPLSQWGVGSHQEPKAQAISFWKLLKGPVVSQGCWAVFSSSPMFSLSSCAHVNTGCRPGPEGVRLLLEHQKTLACLKTFFAPGLKLCP